MCSGNSNKKYWGMERLWICSLPWSWFFQLNVGSRDWLYLECQVSRQALLPAKLSHLPRPHPETFKNCCERVSEWVSECPQRPEGALDPNSARIRSGCELLGMGVGNQAQVLWKSRKRLTLSRSSSPVPELLNPAYNTMVCSGFLLFPMCVLLIRGL